MKRDMCVGTRPLVEVTGFEPAAFWSRTKRATKLRYTSIYGANEETRTPDLLITNQLLYRLSYIGIVFTVAFVLNSRKKYLNTEAFMLSILISHMKSIGFSTQNKSAK